MQTAIRTTTRVLAGGKVTVSDPDLKEGQTVEVIVLPTGSSPVTGHRPSSDLSAAAFFASLPPSRRTPEEWAEFEREFQQRRDEWDR
jgi:hypothetical protein